MKGSLIAATVGLLALNGQKVPEESIRVSMVQLIATPERFDGKFVEVVGYLNLEFEGDSIYLHREDHTQRIRENGLWFDRPKKWEKSPATYSGRYVLVEGKFDADDKGHMGLWPGAITDVTRVDNWPP